MELLNNLLHIICLAIFFTLSTYMVNAQDTNDIPDKPTKYIEVQDEKPEPLFFQGFSLGVDLFSPAQKLLSDYGGLEAAFRLNLKNTYFPIFEMGYGSIDHEDTNTYIKFKTSAPYFKIGLDYNILKDKFQDNKLFVGARYAISNYSFDISGPEVVDPIWGGTEDFSYNSINTTSHWFEFAIGVQVKMWRNIHLGWSVRYKKCISSSTNDYAEPYYIPGYGTTINDSSWGGTYHLVFDLNWGKKKQINMENVELLNNIKDTEIKEEKMAAKQLP